MFHKFLLLTLTVITHKLYVACISCYCCTGCPGPHTGVECPINTTSCYSVGVRAQSMPDLVNYVRGCGFIPADIDKIQERAYEMLLCLKTISDASITHCSAKYCYNSLCNTHTNIEPEDLKSNKKDSLRNKKSNSYCFMSNFYIVVLIEIFVFVVK